MAKKVNETPATEAAEAKKKPGRRPMTPEEKAAAAKLRAAEKEKSQHLQPELFLQYHDSETSMAALVELAKAEFRKEKKRTLITDLKLYVKPEEHIAYYVINESFTGSVSF